MNQDLECRVFGIGGTSAFIGVYLKDGRECQTAPHYVYKMAGTNEIAHITLCACSDGMS